MSFNWRHYLDLANYLQNNAEDLPDFEEACYRSVVSRAYYAVYCLARNFVRDVDNQPFHSDDHQALKNYLTNHPHKARSRLGKQLNNIRIVLLR